MFPDIQTNFWDATLAVPTIIIVTQILKITFKLNKAWVPTLANIIGYSVSIFISHRHDLAAGIFMGFFYGAAAIGTYASIKTALRAYRTPKQEQE
ncbi:hypothetical protein [Alkalihalobacillus pseudalcaliphilus]|uniref:hypothetical protein n=1 Tax=Alkalihalobacillus pseudalcaliphilus TaxID=79884 RepID=UPI000AD96969